MDGAYVISLNSYNMYLVHYVFVMTLPLFLSTWVGGPVLVKFGIVALATILLNYAVSQHIVMPHPRVLVMSLALVSVVLMVVL